jgi:hypothetical protein
MEQTHLNSLLNAFAASLAALSDALALSHTSKTRFQSSGAAAVRKPVKMSVSNQAIFAIS